MSKFNVSKQWWVLLIAFVFMSVIAIPITEHLIPNYQDIGILMAFGIMGLGFLGVYSIDKNRFWWAIILCLLEFTFLASQLVEHFIGTPSKNVWASVLVLGIGSAIIGAVVKHRWIRYLFISASLITFFVVIAIAPITTTLRVFLIAMGILLIALFMWRNRNSLAKSE